jgi:hypothetical protein
VKRFWQGEHHELEAELRKCRPEPRSAFLAALSADLHDRMRRPKAARRAAFVTALTVGMLAVFAAFGGLGYASSAAGHALDVSKIGRIVGISNGSQSANSSKPANAPSSQSNQAQSNNNQQGHDDDHGDDHDHHHPDHDQYKPGKGCGDKNHVHERENECKKPPK